jgi:hypothetical protein
MPRTLARGALVLAFTALLFGCGRKHRSARHAPDFEGASSDGAARVDEIVKWDTELTEDMPGLVGAFVNRAHDYGCEINKTEPEAAVATCDGVKIAMAKSNRVVSVGCRGVTLDECKSLFRRVVETKPGNGEPPPAAAPPPPPPTGTSI